jgi:predicted N-formylglutamate amidohydrolase
VVAFPQAGAEVEAVDPAVVEDAEAAGRFVIVCDHASSFIPPEYASLGLGPAEQEAHVAWDPGALGLARRLARRLDAPLVHATVSRLVIDCNRRLDAPDLVAARSEDIAVPGNAALTAAERERRIASIHAPYHAAIDRLLDARRSAGRETVLIAIHSFTPVFHGIARPWEIGIVFDKDRRVAAPLIDALKTEGLSVGVNEPYSPADRVYYTMTRHGEGRALACAMIEVRNDLIGSEAGQVEWAERIGAHLASMMAATAGSRGSKG